MLATKTEEMKMAVGRLKEFSADERTRMLYEAAEATGLSVEEISGLR
jgi:hypothetical protein